MHPVRNLRVAVTLILLAGPAAAEPAPDADKVFADAAARWQPADGPSVPVEPAAAAGEFTLLVRLRTLASDNPADFATLGTTGSPPLWRLAVEGRGTGRRVVFDLRVPVSPERVAFARRSGHLSPDTQRMIEEGLFRVAVPAPVSAFAGENAHDVLVRRRGQASALELFVDGVLVDADWPIGFLPAPAKEPLPLALKGVERAAVWGRSLSDGEVAALSGGAAAVAERDRALHGPDAERMPYWRPRGTNAFAGDCMPFVHAGRFHLYYLADRRHHNSRWTFGAHQWAHVSSADLKTWDTHPLALPLTTPGEGSICTGSVIFHAGQYHAFYDPRPVKYTGDGTGGVFRVPSADGIHFDKSKATTPLAGVTGGDAEVFWSEANQKFYMITRGDKAGRRQFFFYTAPDLDHWTAAPNPFAFAPNNCDCPHYFVWNGRHYFLASNVARVADKLEGPWTDIPRSSLGVPKTAAWKDGRRLIAGFLGDDGGWGGDAVLHELVALPDGILGEKFVPELGPTTGDQVPLGFVPVMGTANRDGGRVAVDGAAALTGVPARGRVTLTVRPAAGATAFGVRVRGVELRITPGDKAARLGSPGGASPKPNAPGTGLTGLGQPFRLEMILGPNGIVDVCLAGRHALITRGPKDAAGDRLVLFADGGAVVFEDIEVRPLRP